MLAVTHTLASAAVGAQVDHPVFAFALAFLLHLFADTILHWNIYVEQHRWPYVWVALDLLGGFFLAYLLAGERLVTAPIIAAIVGGNLPDITAGTLTLLKRRTTADPFHRFHEGLQNETTNPSKGLVWQVVFALFAVILLRR